MASIVEALQIAIEHHQAGRLQAAEQIYRQILQASPDQPDALHLLGVVAHQSGHHQAAVAHIRRAIALRPGSPSYYNNLGAAYRALGSLDDVVDCCRRAVAMKPDYVDAHNNLGMAYKDQGRLDDAIEAFREARELSPRDTEVWSNLLYTLWFNPDYSLAEISQEHDRWNRALAEPLTKQAAPHANDRSRARRLRVGYVSPDFRRHSVGRFLLPLLEAHDRRRFEIFCYASVVAPDDMTERFQAESDTWRDVRGLSDEQVADVVRRDAIDILVDLTMHMGGNRLLMFARKPAPVQVTYLAYCGTTGLTAIDYRLTDPHIDPPGREEPHYSEKSLRLPDTSWCYRPLEAAPEVGPLPAAGAGHVTFGCLNNFCKVSEAALQAWAQLLKAVPGSRLLLHAGRGSHRQRTELDLGKRGVEAERLAFCDLLPIDEYLQLYNRIDVALDPFPYGGGTTTCDALWMGVPVVSLAGATPVGRAGLSILTNVGLNELVARDAGEYVQIAADLAGDRERLAGLRAGLRARMRQSPLVDEQRFASAVEDAYSQIWARWCDDASGRP